MSENTIITKRGQTQESVTAFPDRHHRTRVTLRVQGRCAPFVRESSTDLNAASLRKLIRHLESCLRHLEAVDQ